MRAICVAFAFLWCAHAVDKSRTGVWSWICGAHDSQCFNQVQVKPPSWLHGSFQMIFWRDLEVTDGNFDWSSFDANLTKSVNAGLNVQPLVYIYDIANPLPDWLTKISKPIEYRRDSKTKGPIEHAPNYLDPAFQNRWNLVIKALATHLAELPSNLKKHVWSSQIVAGITGDNRPWKGFVKNPADAINASAWMAYTRKVADMYIHSFLGTGIPVTANLRDGFSGQQDQGWFLSRAYAAGMRGASLKEGTPSHFYNLNGELVDFKEESPLLLQSQPDGSSFAHARGEMCTNPDPVEGQYGNWAQSPWWSLQANAEWGLTYGLDVWNMYPGWIGNESFAPTMEFFNRHAGEKDIETATAAFVSFRDSLDSADVQRWPVNEYGPVENKDDPTNEVNPDRMVKIQQANAHRGAKLPFPKDAANKNSVFQKKAMALFDVCWSCFPGNYGRYIKQLNPSTTSVGYWQLGPKDQEYGRFARGLEHSTNKTEITLQLDSKFGAAGKSALVQVWYFDKGNDRWAIFYGGTKVRAVQKRDSKRWQEAKVNITLVQHPAENIITLKSLDQQDVVFSLLEVLV